MIRHGEAESNVAGVVSYQHGSVTPLTEKGKEQVKTSAETLKNTGITKIIASPFLRTKQTAEIIKETLGLAEDAIVYDERLIDINAGIYEGKTWGEYFEMFHDASGAIDQRKRFVHRPEGGETLAEVKARVGACLYEVEKTYTNEKILFVGHGASLWMMQSVAVGADMEETIHIRYGANGGNYQQDFVGNATVRELSFVPLPHNSTFELDLHRPYIDTVALVDESGLPMVRVPEVFDCWFESGSMPFASLHYMGDDTTPEGKLFRQRYPADFIAEGLDQTRGWFYSLMVLGVALFNQSPYKRVIVNGLILAEDGQKMSKRLKNYPDLMEVVNKHGADALRYYLLGSQVVQAEELRLSEKDIAQVASKVLGRLENVLSFYELYRDVSLEENTVSPSTHVLDQWIVARLNQVIEQVTTGMESYELDKALRPLDLFVDDISTWYLRRSRDRIKDGDKEAKQTLYYVLKVTARVLAPFTPFIAEEIWQKLKTSSEAESVHLTEWPEKSAYDQENIAQMILLRDVVTLGLEARQKANIKVRQPLGKIEIGAIPLAVPYVEILREELNMKEVEFTSYFENGIAIGVKLDTTITPELKREGTMRELVRAIQDLRKTSGLSPDDRIQLTIETSYAGKSIVEDFKLDIMKTVGATEIVYGTVEASEIVVDDTAFKLAISKIA
jgi:isoleucyl-tRNA synthetase